VVQRGAAQYPPYRGARLHEREWQSGLTRVVGAIDAMTEVIARGMAARLLVTKLRPSRLAAGLVERPRLIELAAHAENKRLTVIKAPAGFGKTSLALTWLNRLRASGAHVAWFSIDTDDDEPARILQPFAQAMRHTGCRMIRIRMREDRQPSAAIPPPCATSSKVRSMK
jgi:hypothetical protein